MKALSIHPYYALAIFALEKSVEVRTWKTEHRGEILICSTAKKFSGTIPSHALCTAVIKDIEPMKKKHLKAALMEGEPVPKDCYAWILDDIKVIKPFPIKGKLSLWECDHDIEYIEGVNESDEKNDQIWNEYFEPLVYKGDKEEW